MKVLMLGWEFPPYISGGLGTACYGLTKALSNLGTEITFVLPRSVAQEGATHVKLLGPGCAAALDLGSTCEFDNVKVHALGVNMYPYSSPGQMSCPVGEAGMHGPAWTDLACGPAPAHHGDAFGCNYASDIGGQVHHYDYLVQRIARAESCDVIHAHDWMTYPAGMTVAKVTGKPLVVHVHSTEFDRSGENVNTWVHNIEHEGMHQADQVIAVSNYTKQICVDRYGVPQDKVSVVYNGVDNSDAPHDMALPWPRHDEKTVLFLGRLTMQKGPEYFLAAARKVLEKMDAVKFIIAGSGDMFTRTVELAAQLGIGHKVHFAGFLRGHDVDRVFRMADLYVMPSVSEPFGIAPLEALLREVPVIVSRQSGVAEILTHALKVDFWDIDEMANMIVAVLRHPSLQETLGKNGAQQARTFQWSDSARRCREVYSSLLSHVA